MIDEGRCIWDALLSSNIYISEEEIYLWVTTNQKNIVIS